MGKNSASSPEHPSSVPPKSQIPHHLYAPSSYLPWGITPYSPVARSKRSTDQMPANIL
ncbi:hypothetical protein [Microseira wollei]|uniref:hypothetical protein n=1 Tax=Microseira wollei TaxID=467598 RepID=UPI001CFDB252|nr:hypothetical protein [Microseira wollei]